MYLQGDSIDAGLLVETVRCVEDEVFRSECDDLRAVGEEFPELPRVVVDAALQRLPTLKGRALAVTKAENGSIILSTCLVGLGVWLLRETLGETVKEAWKESDLNRRLKDFLLGRNETKVRKLKQRIDAKLSVRLHKEGRRVEVYSHVEFSGEGKRPDLQVHVNVIAPSLPTRGQVLNGWDSDSEVSSWLRQWLQQRARRDSARE